MNNKLTSASREGENPRRYQPHVVIKLQLDRIEDNPEVEIEIEIEGAAMQWRSGESWETLGSFDVFEVRSLEALSQAIPRPNRQAIVASQILNGFNWSGRWTYRFDTTS